MQGNKVMHILIIPSEQFVPDENKLEGIFQYHQATILKEGGYRVGALSVKLSFSVPMIIKALFYKTTGRKAGNAADNYSVSSLLKLGYTKLFKPHKFVTTEAIDGITVYRVDGLYRRPPGNNKNHLSWITAGMVAFKQYAKKQGKPDLIHAHDAIYAGMLAQKINETFGVPYIITEHSSTYALKTTDDAILQRVKNAHANAVGLFAVSEAFAQLLNKLFSFNRFKYLPNVLDQYLEKKKYEAVLNNHSKFIFLNIAVLKPVKDQHTLIKAFKKVVAENENAELWIGGNGELETELKTFVNDFDLQNKVKFLGLLSRDEVIQQIQNCNCFVLSSKYETFGVVIIEAMLFGKPVIVTRCGVGQNIVTENVGYVVEVGNDEQLAAAMLRMMETHTKYNSDTIRSFTIKNFGREKFLQNMNNIYKELV